MTSHVVCLLLSGKRSQLYRGIYSRHLRCSSLCGSMRGESYHFCILLNYATPCSSVFYGQDTLNHYKWSAGRHCTSHLWAPQDPHWSSWSRRDSKHFRCHVPIEGTAHSCYSLQELKKKKKIKTKVTHVSTCL